jgi:uncharacterized NAD(P)/FAD-binding protein YdhS
MTALGKRSERERGRQSVAVAVVGAGFSGIMVAVHLAHLLPPEHRLLLCERGRFARGVAYSTPNAHHLLNVRAANMSALPAQPLHFQDWLRRGAITCPGEVVMTDAGIFASRGLYGRYLADLLDRANGGAAGDRLERVADEVVDIETVENGHRLTFANGEQRTARAVVLAVGNVATAQPVSDAYRPDPWARDVTEGLHGDGPVVIIGTGLTMVDLVIELRDSGFPGPVIAISRRGLLPHRHAISPRWPTPAFSDAERGSLLLLARAVLREVRSAQDHGIDWRGVIDSLRPITESLWQGLSWQDRARFLRHLRPIWDAHRHRVCEPIGREIDRLRGQGFLTIRRGRVTEMRFDPDGASVGFRRRGGTQETRIAAQRVINATGIANLAGAESTLLRALLARGTLRPDPLGIGLDVTNSLQTIDAAGRVAPNLWALGPLVRGVFWECVAVPDIRLQAQRVADEVAAAVDSLVIA